MQTLVLAEKPSVAQSIAAVLGAKQRRDGYAEGGGYLVSWCYGHLAELSDAAVYNADFAKWKMNDLPIIPENFRFSIAPDKRKQFDAIDEALSQKPESFAALVKCWLWTYSFNKFCGADCMIVDSFSSRMLFVDSCYHS